MLRSGDAIDMRPKPAVSKNLRHRSFDGFTISQENAYLSSRRTVLFNSDCQIALAAPKESLTKLFL